MIDPRPLIAAGATLVLALGVASLLADAPTPEAVLASFADRSDVRAAGSDDVVGPEDATRGTPGSSTQVIRHPDRADRFARVELATVDPAPGRVYGPIETARLALRIDDLETPTIGRVRASAGVRHATTVQIGSVQLVDDEGAEHEVTVAAVDPVEFRALTPQPTADAIAVWERLDDGEAAFTHEAAEELDVELGGFASFGVDGSVKVRVGAFASNGTPPVADVIVDRGTGSLLGLSEHATVLVSVEDGVDPETLAHELAELTDGEITVIPDPRQARPVSTTEQHDADTVWDVLAICESSGDWHINTGNGYYGGLQFLPESWWLVGGEGMPHEASREEQIHRAELLLAIQGWEAWPACSLQLGLREP